MRKTSSRWPSLFAASDLNTDHKFKREDRLRVLVCVFVRAMPIHFCHRRIHFLSVLFHTNSGLCGPTKFPVLSVRPLSPAVLVLYHMSLVIADEFIGGSGSNALHHFLHHKMSSNK